MRGKDDVRYMNASNSASAALKQNDARMTASLALTMYGLGEGAADGAVAPSQRLALLVLRDRVFLVSEQIKRFDDLKTMITYIQEYEAKRHDLDFEIDGLVIKLDDNTTYNALGVVGKNPRGAVAYKFPPEEVTTRILKATANV